MTRDEIVLEAQSWIGIPWRHQGRLRSGIDCAGLIVVIGRDLGLTTYDPTGYPRRPDGTFVKEFRFALKEKRPLDAQVGDVMIFSQLNYPCHCGILSEYMEQPSVIHSHATRGKVIEETLEQAMNMIGKPIFCFEYPGVDD